MENYLLYTIHLLVTLFGLLLLLYVLLSFFMSPYHPLRQTLGRVIDPLLDPIRQVLPPIAGLDFSPLVLWLLIRLLNNLVVSLITRL